MRILELINTLEQGGAEQITSALALALKQRGHDLSVVCLRDKGFMPIPEERFKDAGIEVVAFNKQDGFSHDTLRKLAAYARERRVDVIHTHNPLVNHYGVASARLARVPVVVNTVHGINTLELPSWARALYVVSCHLTARLVPVCRAVNDALQSRFRLNAHRCKVIENGIPLDRFAQLPIKPRGGTFTFGAIGRFVPVKNYASLLRAFAQVWRQRPTCELELVGEGETGEHLLSLACELGIREAVRFPGWAANPASFIANWDAFVMSSLSEGLPLSLLEAMASAKPVVCTAVGGIPEVVNNAQCGWLCPPGDPTVLAKRMLDAMNDSQSPVYGLRGRTSALSVYSESRMVDRYESLFESLCQRRSAA